MPNYGYTKTACPYSKISTRSSEIDNNTGIKEMKYVIFPPYSFMKCIRMFTHPIVKLTFIFALL